MDRILQAGIIVTITGLVGVVMVQVVARYGFVKAPSWTEEAARFLFLFIIAFAAGLAVKEKAYVNVDVIFNLLPRKLGQALNILIYIALVMFSAVIFVQAIKFAELGTMQRSSVLLLPMQYVFGTVAISGFFLTIYFFIELFNLIKNFTDGLGGGHK